MEEGEGNLYSTIKRVSPDLPCLELFEDLVEQIGSCLEELSKDSAHRDIKPANIIVFSRPSPFSGYVFKLADLGLVLPPKKTAESTYSTVTYGTPLYLSGAMSATLE